jgi:hypothetical protein
VLRSAADDASATQRVTNAVIASVAGAQYNQLSLWMGLKPDTATQVRARGLRPCR